MLEVDKKLIANFLDVIEMDKPDGRQKEQLIQDFLEENTVLIPSPNQLNHLLHFESIVSKFPLGTEFKTDYVYLSKSSDRWYVVMVELELPGKNIFKSSTSHPRPTAEFNAALDQVRDWKRYVDDHKREILQALSPIMHPLGDNPVSFKYELIIGRSDNKNLTRDRKQYIAQQIDDTGIDIYTYDSLIEWYKHDKRIVKNVLSLKGKQYRFKHLHKHPTSMFGFLGPESILLSTDQELELVNAGYEIDEWKKGKPLHFNGMRASFPSEL